MKNIFFLDKDAAIEAEVKAARERQLVPLEQRMSQFAAEEEAPANQTSVRKRKKSNSRNSAREDKISPPKKKSKGEKLPTQIEVENDDDEYDHQIPDLDNSSGT